jgi:predicted ribosome quality control (RQC) complex YloA/Tae2 family protein
MTIAHHIAHHISPFRRLKGQVLVGVGMPVPFDRVLQLDFALRPGEPAALRLMCEIQGRLSNAILVDGAGKIVLAARQIGQQQSTARSVRVGAPYVPPPAPPGCVPDAGESAGEWSQRVRAAAPAAQQASAARGCGVAAAITAAYRGTGPALCRDMCEIAGVAPSAEPESLTATEWDALHAAWQLWLERLASGKHAVTQDPASGRVSVLGVHSTQRDSVHACVEDIYRAAQHGERTRLLHGRLSKAASTAAASLQKKLGSLRKQKGSHEEGEETQKLGDLVMGHVHCWPQRERTMTVQDWDTGAPRRWPLPEDVM